MPTFLDAYSKVKAAVASSETTFLSHICVKAGMMFATDSRMTAAAEVDFDGTFMAPAQEFYRAMTILGEDNIKVKIKDDHKIVISKSRRRVTIETLDPEGFAYQLPKGDPLRVPKGFVEALKAVAPFMSDDRTKAWANAVRIKNNTVYATNNITVVCSEFAGWGSDVDITVPDWVINYILSRDVELEFMSYTDSSVSFNWKDNSWLSSARLSQEMSDVVLTLIDKIEDAEFALTEEWKEAFNMVTQMSDDVLFVTPSMIKAGKGHAKIEAEVLSVVEEDTAWHPKFLELVVKQATHFDPGGWPGACSWKGANSRGLIIGRKT